MLFFLGNKAFVIDFLRRGLLCCVYLRPTGKELSGENKYPPPEFRRAYCSNMSGVFAVICQQIYTYTYYCVEIHVIHKAL